MKREIFERLLTSVIILLLIFILGLLLYTLGGVAYNIDKSNTIRISDLFSSYNPLYFYIGLGLAPGIFIIGYGIYIWFRWLITGKATII